MGNQAQKSVPNVEDSSDKSKEVATASYEPHPQFLQDGVHASPHSITNKGATWIMGNVENVTTDTKVRDWRSTSNSAFQYTGQQKGSSNNVSKGGSPTDRSDNVAEVGSHAKPGTVSLTQNAVSNKGDTKKDSGDVVSISRRKKILRALINPESDNNKGIKSPFRSLANQSLNLNYSEPNLLARAQMENSDTFPAYTRCKKVSLTESNSEDSMSPEPRKNSIGGQSVSSEYATPAEDMSEITSPLDWSPNQDFMKLCWPSRESREESNSLQRKASETLIKVAGEISMLQREIQEAVSEKEQIRPPAEEPRFLRSASDSLRTRYKGSNTSNSSETLKTPELETRWIELAKGWQLRLKSIEGATDSGLKDLESCTLSQDKQQKTRFSWDQDVGTAKKEDGTVDKKQYEMEVKRLEGLLSQQEEKTSTLEIMKNREVQDLRREESRLKMEVVLKESELKALWEKMSSLQEAFEQANRKCKAQEDRILSLDKELEQFRKQHRAEKEKVVSLEETIRQKCKDHKAETDKVAALEQSLQQKLKDHRVEMQRALTLEQALEYERRDHRIEKERAMSLEMALQQAQSEQRAHAETASSLKKTLEQTDSVQQVRTERVLSLEKELEESQGALQAQRERASSLENLLSQLRNELKMQTERIAYLQKEESLKLDKETALRHTHDLVRQLEGEKAETQKKLQDLQEKMHADAEEWRQFQADLQTAVAVADDFKMEAEEQLHAAREKLRDVEKENERLKAEVVQMKGFVTVDHGSHREKTEEAVNSLTDPPTVNGITRLRKGLPAGSMNSSTQLNQVSTETSGIIRTSNLVNKATRVTFQTADNDSSLARNEDRRNQLRNSMAQEITSNDILKTREKGQDKPGSQVRRYAGSRRNALIQWCQSRTVGYKNIEVTNFSVCWSDGMAFCALLHSYLPDRIPFNELVPAQKKHNLKLAFDTANSVGIPQTLTLEEMLDRDGPDWQSVLLYVESIYQHFEQ